MLYFCSDTTSESDCQLNGAFKERLLMVYERDKNLRDHLGYYLPPPESVPAQATLVPTVSVINLIACLCGKIHVGRRNRALKLELLNTEVLLDVNT